MKLVLATANVGKQREFAALLSPLGVQLLLSSALGIDSAAETGATFEANALLKARHAAGASGLPALADDSGLEVDALDGRPGVYSARYAGAQATEADNNARLLSELAGVPPQRRSARYRCVLALVRDAADTSPLIASGSWEGRIALQPAGNGGFGYDPLFLPEGLEVSAAELPLGRKNALSHRARALAALVKQLERSPLSETSPGMPC
ncbi:MAG TPA: RdgB/HAM1 family non-canonical purine NTP pyrophosphatase [Steroidobacteraceae bacterium]|jgi:XTP/dITP diphosphohydrolase